MDRINVMWADLAGRLRVIWEAQNRQMRMIMIGGGVAALAIIVFLGYLYLGHKPSYQVLFANLSSDDASVVTQRLKDDKIDYHLSQTPSGTTVYVPESSVYEERVQIAGAGLLKSGGTGYELFDKTNFGMTEFQEKIAKTRATEGELQRTIQNLDPVEAARVHIAAPDNALYSSTQSPTTASIAIKTKSGQNLSPQEVKGITLLVANAVEGLKPDNVTIVNQDGSVLVPAATASDASGAATSADALKMTQDQLLAKQRYETNLQENIQSMLDDTLGKKRAVARVSTKMNFDANSTETKTYAPQGTVLSNQSEHESYVGTQPQRTLPVGVPGTTSNIGTYQGLQQNVNNGRYNKSKTTTNYNISEENAKHIDAPGKVLQTSVAVLVDVPGATTTTTTATAGANAAATTQTYALSPANVAQIRNTVIAAAGLNLAAGDQVSVEAVPFNPAVTGQYNTSAGGVTTTVFGIPVWVLIALLGVAGVGAIGFLAMRSRRRTAFRPSTELPSFDATLAEELPPFEEHPMLDGAPGIAAPIRSAADLTREQMIEYVTTVAQENPDSIAKLVKLWLAE